MEEKEYTIDEVKDMLTTEKVLNNILDKYELLLSRIEKTSVELEKLSTQIEKINDSVQRNSKDIKSLQKSIIPSDSHAGNLMSEIQGMIDSMEDDVCDALDKVGGSIAIKTVDEMVSRNLIDKKEEKEEPEKPKKESKPAPKKEKKK